MNSYQKRKGRLLAACLLQNAVAAGISVVELPAVAAAMNDAQWRRVAFTAGLPVCDRPARCMAIAYLLSL